MIRIIQEALSNVRRHACAHRVWVQFWQDQGEINVSIEDDGNGFDLDVIATRDHSKQSYGLQIMEERVQYINGKLKIESGARKRHKIIIANTIYLYTLKGNNYVKGNAC